MITEALGLDLRFTDSPTEHSKVIPGHSCVLLNGWDLCVLPWPQSLLYCCSWIPQLNPVPLSRGRADSYPRLSLWMWGHLSLSRSWLEPNKYPPSRGRITLSLIHLLPPSLPLICSLSHFAWLLSSSAFKGLQHFPNLCTRWWQNYFSPLGVKRY